MHRYKADQPPYLSVAMIVRNSASKPYDHDWSFEKTLQCIRERFPAAELVIVDTQSSDETPAVAQQYADVFDSYTGPRGDWTKEMFAFDDAAAARQRSFDLATGRWVLWIDDDDQIPGAAETEKLLKLNGRWREQAAVPGQNFVEPQAVAEPMWLEDTLRFIDEKYPKVEALVCGYLYQTDKDGLAIGHGNGFQERERFLKRRDDGTLPWAWQESAHELLVPKNGDLSGLHFLPSTLFWHHKLWTPNEQEFTIKRHGKILLDRYLAGERNCRNLIYLSIFSASPVMPELHGSREKFTQEAIEYATTLVDNVRAYILKGNFETERGFYTEAKAAFAAAAAFLPELPDAWVAGGNAAMQFEDYAWAVEYYRRSLPCRVTIASQINPRQHTLETPALLMQALTKVADNHIACGHQDSASALLEEARGLANQLRKNPAVGPDAVEARSIWAHAMSRADGQLCVMALYGAWQFLVRNDETQKALALVDAIPNTSADHPIAIEMEQWARKMRLHFSDEKAYFAFYGNYAKGETPSPESIFNPQMPLERAEYLAAWIRYQRKPVDVLEVGPYDGVIGIHVLRSCPNLISYTAVDADERALDRFRLRAEQNGIGGPKLRLFHSEKHLDWPIHGQSDAVVCYEMIEHVPDPVALVKELLRRVRYPNGRLFLSTPWKSYDKSQPEDLATRDPRIHVRAMTLHDMTDIIEAAGGEIVEAYRYPESVMFGIGAAMTVQVKPRTVCIECDEPARPVSFAVPGALWPWNATTVETTGMGASENMIVKLARELAKTRRVDVYAPVPEEEIREGVRYWPLAQLRHAPKDAALVVSRTPAWTQRQLAALDMAEHFSKRILWLQDVGYQDLNAETGGQHDHVVGLSEWHAEYIRELTGVQPEIIGNFLLPELFQQQMGLVTEKGIELRDVERRPHHFIYSSSPDRGLIPLLEMWPEILKAYPDATLDIFYGWQGCKKLSIGNPPWSARYREVRRKYEKLRWQTGVADRGRINGRQLAVEMMSAAVWYYPCYGFAEAGCATAFEVRAAGCVPVVPPIAALTETAACPETQWLPSEERWKALTRGSQIDRTMAAVRNAIETSASTRGVMSAIAIEKHALAAELPKWERLLK